MWIFVGNVRFVLHSFIKSPMRHFFSLTRCERVCTCIWRYKRGDIFSHRCYFSQCCWWWCCCRCCRIVFCGRWRWLILFNWAIREHFLYLLHIWKKKQQRKTKYNYWLHVYYARIRMYVCKSFCESSHNIKKFDWVSKMCVFVMSILPKYKAISKKISWCLFSACFNVQFTAAC